MAAIENEKIYALKIRESANDGSDFGTPDADYRFLFVGEDGDIHLKDPADAVTDFPAGGATGAPDDATYLVTSSNAGLSAEVVVTAQAGGNVPQVVRKTGGQSVNASTTLVNVTDLAIALASSEIWEFAATIWCDAHASADMKFAFTVPTSATLWWGSPGFENTAGTAFNGITIVASGTARDFSMAGVGTIRIVTMTGLVVNSTNAGNLQLQFAQNTSNGSDATVHANSTLKAWRLA